VFGKIAHKKCGANNLETSKKAFIFKAFFTIFYAPCMNLGGFFILKIIKNLEI
jgi:hypothetical protein